MLNCIAGLTNVMNRWKKIKGTINVPQWGARRSVGLCGIPPAQRLGGEQQVEATSPEPARANTHARRPLVYYYYLFFKTIPASNLIGGTERRVHQLVGGDWDQ